VTCRLPRRLSPSRRSLHRFLWFSRSFSSILRILLPQRMRVDEDRQPRSSPLPPLATRKPRLGWARRHVAVVALLLTLAYVGGCSCCCSTRGYPATPWVGRRWEARARVTVASSVRRPSPAPRTHPLTFNLDRCTATTLCLSASSWPCATDLSITGSRPEYIHLFCLLIDVSNSKGKVLQWLGISFLNIVFLGLLHAHLHAIHLLIALAFATSHASSCM
jgi:hypothetical protein